MRMKKNITKYNKLTIKRPKYLMNKFLIQNKQIN